MALAMASYDVEKFFDLSPDMLCIAGVDGYFKKVNKSFSRVLGWTDDELYLKPFTSFIHSDDISSTLFEVEKLSMGIPTIYFENRYLCADGSYKLLAWNGTSENESQLIYAVAHDITEMRMAQIEARTLSYQLEEAQALVQIDALTGLLNRRALNSRLSSTVNIMQRLQRPLSLLMIDLDNFRDINSQRGHQAGDNALRLLANCLLDNTRNSDLVFRYGGDEFLIALPNTSINDAMDIAKALCEQIKNISDKDKLFTISIGIASIDFKEVSDTNTNYLSQVIQQADEALYCAKAQGKDQVFHYGKA